MTMDSKMQNVEGFTLSAFKILMNNAVSNASSRWDVNFTNELADRLDTFQERLFVSPKQLANLKRIAGLGGQLAADSVMEGASTEEEDDENV